MDGTADIFAGAVLDREVVLELRTDLAVQRRFIGHQHGFLRKVRIDDRLNVGRIGVVDLEAADFAIEIVLGEGRVLKARK